MRPREIEGRGIDWAGRRNSGCLLAVAAAFIVPLIPVGAACASPAPLVQNSPAQITEFPLASVDFPGAIAAGSDGKMWFANSQGNGVLPAYEEKYIYGIDSITSSGQIAEFRAPTSYASELTAGPDGSIWYLGEDKIGRITPAGQVTEFPVSRPFEEGQITAGPDGNLWVTKRDDSGTDAIIRVTPSGQISEFPIRRGESGPNAITAGGEGNVWFTEYFGDQIGRITPNGQITEFAVPTPNAGLKGIAPGPEGDLWFTEEAANKIGRITPSGQITKFRLPTPAGYPGQIVAGPDGRLWFTDGFGLIGRITPTGRFTKMNILGNPVGIASGPEGRIWYSASTEGPCEGGGGSCESRTIDGHGIIGRITPGPLTVEVLSARARVHDGRTKVRLVCGGGDANSVCHGTLALTWSITHRGSINLLFLAKRRFQIAVDSTRALTLILSKKAIAIIAKHPRLSARIFLKVAGGQEAQSHITLER